MKYTLRYIEAPDGFTGEILEVKGVVSQGDTLNELVSNIEDALELMLEELKLIALEEPIIQHWENAKIFVVEL